VRDIIPSIKVTNVIRRLTPESNMPKKYEKVEDGDGDVIDLDWRKDEAMVKESKWGGIVDFVDGHVDGYKLESVLRMGFFRVKAPVFADSFVRTQCLFVLLLVGLFAAFFIATHSTGVMYVDSNLVSKKYSYKVLND
jgi:hypothetical protein